MVTSLGTLWAHRPVNADIVDTSTGSLPDGWNIALFRCFVFPISFGGFLEINKNLFLSGSIFLLARAANMGASAGYLNFLN